jgi:hypothetical protein
MKKLNLLSKFLILLVISTFLFAGVSNAQVKKTSSKYKPPMMIVELVGFYGLPMMDAKGEVGDFFAFKNYGLKTGFGGEINIKVPLDKKGSLRPTLSLGYVQFQNNDDNNAWIDTNRIQNGFPVNKIYAPVVGTSNLYIRSAYAGLGFEYAFTKADKKGIITPFAGIDFDLNVMWGLYKQRPDPTLGVIPGQASSGVEISYTIKSDIRFGLGLGVGSSFRLSKAFGLTVGTKFKIANLLGKKSERTALASVDPNDENKMNLLDKADVTLNSQLSKDRSIGYMQFYLGFSFFVGKK